MTTTIPATLMGAAIMVLVMATPGVAGVKLTFEGIPNYDRPANYYNGGSSVFGGTGQATGNTGPTLGVVITDAAFILKRYGDCVPSGDYCGLSGVFPKAPSGITALYNLAQNSNAPRWTVINFAAGFTGEASVWHTGGQSGFVVYRDVGGSEGNGGFGVPLGQLQMPQTSGCSGIRPETTADCRWTKYTINFTGTARSIVLAGNGSYFDDVMLGTGAVPEPASWALLLAGFGLTGAAMRRRSSVLQPAKA
ncbi:PEPxxWA-CTERM sorting domain-containing protein [Sandarakinorhabdus sp.]|uniref:PEPxxWA-CTERM sorting domain-containing protein n=1 Tax=Sandarakinorhabdus sp. TaxID=1916663 RepID=UPI00286E0F14|nr:PEPxxWA-CTERM sorting domain-containing protein [Sandarakinorhabdus sp.]